MKKETLIEVVRWSIVVICICVCLVLMFAEPNMTVAEVGFFKWAATFVAIKAGAVICGIVALVLSDTFIQVKKVTDNE